MEKPTLKNTAFEHVEFIKRVVGNKRKKQQQHEIGRVLALYMSDSWIFYKT